MHLFAAIFKYPLDIHFLTHRLYLPSPYSFSTEKLQILNNIVSLTDQQQRVTRADKWVCIVAGKRGKSNEFSTQKPQECIVVVYSNI